MEFEKSKDLYEDAKKLRSDVFLIEQGFSTEFDDVDSFATHLYLYNDGELVGYCRYFYDNKQNAYVIGRVVVSKKYRKQGFGAVIVKEAIRQLSEITTHIELHAQLRAQKFYETLGFIPYGNIEYDEYCPHTWMYLDF